GELAAQVAERHAHRQHQVEVHASVPHLDVDAFACGGAKQGRFGFLLLEIAADGDRFGNTGAVVEFQRRDARHRILGGEIGTEVVTGDDVDLDEFDGCCVDAFFGQKDAY